MESTEKGSVPSPLYSGERDRVRGGTSNGVSQPTAVLDVRPLTPALSPEYRGEGVGGRSLTISRPSPSNISSPSAPALTRWSSPRLRTSRPTAGATSRPIRRRCKPPSAACSPRATSSPGRPPLSWRWPRDGGRRAHRPTDRFPSPAGKPAGQPPCAARRNDRQHPRGKVLERSAT